MNVSKLFDVSFEKSQKIVNEIRKEVERTKQTHKIIYEMGKIKVTQEFHYDTFSESVQGVRKVVGISSHCLPNNAYKCTALFLFVTGMGMGTLTQTCSKGNISAYN